MSVRRRVVFGECRKVVVYVGNEWLKVRWGLRCCRLRTDKGEGKKEVVEVAVVGDRGEKEIAEREWECTGSRRKREFEVVLVVCSRIEVVYAWTCPMWAEKRGAG
ncbi:hypothetical protein PIB30_093730 [Stylosanthes scabra]|uniref:Uncharacterized protein n=1 Tax=Stylosanthes scabra TaxID=79078 RepID=A0ABU6VVD5_9FABA|nr:hypothetical protein [Stylosanthes scabra]